MSTHEDTAQVSLPDGYVLSTDPAHLDLDRVHHWLSTDAYWALGRSYEKQRAAVEGSLNFGIYEGAHEVSAPGAVRQAPVGGPPGEQRAFARLVTDRATFAWLCDVYVAREARGRGLGSALVAAVQAETDRLGVPRLLLATSDAHEVYRRAGFGELAEPKKWMAYIPE